MLKLIVDVVLEILSTQWKPSCFFREKGRVRFCEREPVAVGATQCLESDPRQARSATPPFPILHLSPDVLKHTLVNGLMESWADDSWDCSDNRRNSGCTDTRVYHRCALLLPAPAPRGWVGPRSPPCSCPPPRPRPAGTAPPAPPHDASNGGEPAACVPAHYEPRALSLASPLSAHGLPDFYANTRAFSTDV
ncbi:hypothetical protein AAFF_G00330540 [Aldrovandia affinis]|uniref:Uncharacterized protein n=1 Tax=Aldrovandia affinis TaxID=143900 RepID=A0AAD7R795_9TELE|nr:hypothetical protein AAFF_G00330540 [Aldrovandia affinis]